MSSDTDGSGTVNGVTELKKLMGYCGQNEELAELILKHFDKNKDGVVLTF